jgi:NTP pyrophosphatase (non-canonical NTP hydrolase)
MTESEEGFYLQGQRQAAVGMTINEMAARAIAHSKAKGFHGAGVQPTVGDLLMLMVTELGEAFEEFRKGKSPNETYYHVTETKCPTCDGTGEVHSHNPKCWDCKGGIQRHSKPEGLPSELADVVICIGDFCGRYGIDLDAIISEKMAYNETRPFMHGGKKL